MTTTWTFADDYGASYPALSSSILSQLAFDSHSLQGSAFTGVIDVAASGAALAVLGSIAGMQAIAVSGTVTDSGGTLTVSLRSTDDTGFQAGVAGSIPLIGGSVTQAAWLSEETVCTTADTADEGPGTDALDLHVTLAVGSTSVTLACQVPMSGGLFSLSGDFTGVAVSLDDLGFLTGSLGSGNGWFPSGQLAPYTAGSPSFELLSMALTAYAVLTPSFGITLSSVTLKVGIGQLPLMGEALYMDPLGVWVTVTNPTGAAAPHWGLEGTLKLLNYVSQGPAGLAAPDFELDFAMSFPTAADGSFGVSGALPGPSGKPVNVLLRDLLGASASIGLSDDLTVNAFDFSTSADGSTGTVSGFSTSVAMSGQFGLFQQLEVESFSVALAYTG